VYLAVGTVLFLSFDPASVQSGDSWITYLPAAVAAGRGDLAGFREALTFGQGRPPLPPLSIALLHAVVPGIDHLGASQLSACLSAVLFLAAAHRLLLRWVSVGEAVLGALLVLATPVVLPFSVYTTPDVLFAAVLLLMVEAILDRRAGWAVLLFGVSLFVRGNGAGLAPGLLLFLWGRRRWPLHVAAVAGLLWLRQTVGLWAHPDSSLGRSPAEEWHSSIFLADATGWSLASRLRWSDAEQYLLFARRIFVSGPWDLIRELWSFPAIVLAAAGAAVLARRVTLTGAVLAAGFYVLSILFHWEARYWIPAYAILLLAGWTGLVSRIRFRGRTLLAAAVLTVAAISGATPLRRGFQPRGSGHRHPGAQDPRALDAMLARADPARVSNCNVQSFAYLNYLRFSQYGGRIRCVGTRFWRPEPADFEIARTREASGTPIHVFSDGFGIYPSIADWPDRPPPPAAANPPTVLLPGATLSIHFEAPPDGQPIGAEWQGDTLAQSILARTLRHAAIIKADDLLEDRTAFHRLIALGAELDIPVSIGLITKSLQSGGRYVTYLRGLDPDMVELWHHGWDHQLSPARHEFSGSGLEHQREHLRRGLEIARRVLGIDLHTFGAPGNSTDGDTVRALAELEVFEVVFFRPDEVPGKITLRPSLGIEASPGKLRPAGELRAAYEAAQARHDPLLVLQIHPAAYTEADWSSLATSLRFLSRDEGRRFALPTAHVRLQQDRARLRVRKTGLHDYEIDARGARHRHVLDLYPLPATSR
jgi:peptidoglycan/xylan/chitin deacetylase (PgdA/CDA1 family)